MNNFSIDNYINIDKIAEFIGDPADLTTEADNIIDAINEVAASGDGGDAVIIQGNFKTAASGTKEIVINNAPNTYPKMIMCTCSESVIESLDTANTIYLYYVIKSELQNAPTYESSGTNNSAMVGSYYYNGSTYKLSYNSGVNTYIASGWTSPTAGYNSIKFTNNNTVVFLSHPGTASRYGFKPNTTYTYTIIY